MINQKLWYLPVLENEPEYIQRAIVHAGEKLLKKYKCHWALATKQENCFYVLIIEDGKPVTMPCAAYLVTTKGLTVKPRIKKVKFQSVLILRNEV